MQKALIALDASTEACSAALQLYEDTQPIGFSLSVRHEVAPRQHSHLLQEQLNELLAEIPAEAVLAAIVVGQGPGSFAGIRIAAAVAQGLAAVREVPIVGLSSMLAIAQGFYRLYQGFEELLVVINDAKMGEIYAGAYFWDGEKAYPVLDEVLLPIQNSETIFKWIETLPIDKQHAPIKVISSTPDILLPALGSEVEWAIEPNAILPNAQDLLGQGYQAFLQGKAVAPEAFEPRYLRKATAWKTLDRQ